METLHEIASESAPERTKKLRHHLGGRRGTEHRGADAVLAQQLAEHLRGQRMKITLRAGDHSEATARRLARLAHERVQRRRSDPGGEMLVGRGELVAVPALADFALSRGQQVHADDLLPGTRRSSRSSVSRTTARRSPRRRRRGSYGRIHAAAGNWGPGGPWPRSTGRGRLPWPGKAPVGQAHRLVGIACRRGDTRREKATGSGPSGYPFGAHPLEQGVRVPSGSEDDEELVTA